MSSPRHFPSSCVALLGFVLLATGCVQRVQPVPLAPAPAPGTEYVYRQEFPTRQVTATRLNVRQGPATSYGILAVLRHGEPVEVLQRVGNWFMIRRPQGAPLAGGYQEGWVYGGYLSGYEQEIPVRGGTRLPVPVQQESDPPSMLVPPPPVPGAPVG